MKANHKHKKMKSTTTIIEEELDNVGNDYGWCGCCMKGIDSRGRICEDCFEFAKHLVKRTKLNLQGGIEKGKTI